MIDVKRILLVEDSPNDIKLTLSALRDARVANEIVVTRDGEEAMDYLLRRGSFQLRSDGVPLFVLLDLKLPKLNGLEVLEQLRGEPAFKHLPVIMMTSSREEPDIQRSYELGVNAYVVKPVDYPEFQQAVRQLGLFWAAVNQPPPEN